MALRRWCMFHVKHHRACCGRRPLASTAWALCYEVRRHPKEAKLWGEFGYAEFMCVSRETQNICSLCYPSFHVKLPPAHPCRISTGRPTMLK